jgi:hypothetical protein
VGVKEEMKLRCDSQPRAVMAYDEFLWRTVSVMLDSSKNQLLTQVGPSTPMGELLRRYWMPIAAVSE